MRVIKIGSRTFDSSIFMAALAGCSDLAFRLISREHGATLCFFEMVDANCIVRDRRQTYDILKTVPKDRPIAGQILGSDPSMMADAAQKLTGIAANVSFVDINCACPAKKVIKKRAGAYLLNELDNIRKIVVKVVQAVDIPVTVKLRIGYERIDAAGIARTAKICEAAGASALFVHGRTARQGYSGGIDYGSIKSVKESVSIPVFGNGNIFCARSAGKMLAETGCDGILVGRGALGNPWIFGIISECLKGSCGDRIITRQMKKKALSTHLSYVEKFKDTRESTKTGIMRKVSMWYIRGLPEAARIRKDIGRAADYAGILKLVENL